MKPRSSLLLVGILAVLCAGYWAVIHVEQRRTIQEQERKRLFDFSPTDIRTVSIKQENADAVVGERAEDGSWVITAPHKLDANPIVWNRLTEALAGLANERTVAETAADLTPYDLDEPALTVKATLASGEEVNAHFGALDPTQGFRYAQLAEGPVFLVDAKAYFELDRSLLWLRQRLVFNIGDAGITRIEFARMRPRTEGTQPAPNDPAELAKGELSNSVVLQVGPDGVWNILEPVQGRGNQDLATALVRELQYAAGDNFVDAPESLSDYRLDPPTARVTVLTGPESKPQSLYFGGIKDDGGEGLTYVKREGEPSVFTIGAHVWNLFPKTIDGFRENRLLTRSPGDIRSFQYVRGDTNITLVDEAEGGWKLTKPAEEPCDQTVVSAFINILSSVTGKTFFDEVKPEFGLDAPTIDIALWFKGEEQPTHILVGAATPEGDAHYVRQDSGVITTVQVTDVNRLSLDTFNFRSKALLGFNTEEAVRVALRVDAVDYVFERATEIWRVMSPANKAWENQSDMKTLLKSINPIAVVAAETKETPADIAFYGLDAPTVTVEVTTTAKNDPTKQTTLGPVLIGRPCDDNSQQRFAASPSRPEILRIEQSVVDGIRDALKGIRDKEQKPANP